MDRCNRCNVIQTPDNTRSAAKGKGRKSGLRTVCRSCENEDRRVARKEKQNAPLQGRSHFVTYTPEPLPTPVVPEKQVHEPQVLLEKFAIIPDCHHPHAHKDYRVMLRALQAFQPHGLVILGDFADAESLSAHPKTEKGASDFAEEVAAVNAELDILDKVVPNLHWKKYIEGNHEWRLQRYLANNAQALMGMLNIQQCFKLVERGWEFTSYMHHTRIGKIHFTHDTGTAGMNAHRNARDIFMGSAVIGHTHRMAYEVRGVWGGAPVVTAMFGWLGDPAAVTYIHQAAAAMWPRGFGIGYHDKSSGLCYMTPVPIVNGTCVVNGQLVT